MTTTAVPIQAGIFGWWREARADARRALLAGMFGWMLDAFDVMLFALRAAVRQRRPRVDAARRAACSGR